jgi:uncharacterized protein
MTPTVGVQTMLIVGTWFAFKKLLRRDASLVQALLWAFVNNPLTMVPMYYGFYVTGEWLLRDEQRVTGYDAFVDVWTHPGVGLVERLTQAADGIIVPTLVGCLPFAVLSSVTSYYWAVALLRRRRGQALVYETFRT